MPGFLKKKRTWLGLLVISIFYGSLGWMPAPVGRIADTVNPPTTITGFYVLDSLLTGDSVALASSLSHLIWPAMVLSVGATASCSITGPRSGRRCCR